MSGFPFLGSDDAVTMEVPRACRHSLRRDSNPASAASILFETFPGLRGGPAMKTPPITQAMIDA
jgi:hypothetical protein